MRDRLSCVAMVLVLAAIPRLGWAAGGCASNADCKGGRVCQAGACAEPPKACEKDTDCPGEQICNDRHCANPGKPAAAAAPPAPTPPPAAPARAREGSSCRRSCDAARKECDEEAAVRRLDCAQVAKDATAQQSCAAQVQDALGQCEGEAQSCASACH
jgi:hypothetical protein